MSLTIVPDVEACQALVTQIIGGSTYVLDMEATYSDLLPDRMEEFDGVRVDVIPEESETLEETLATEDRTSHQIRVHVRSRCDSSNQDAVDELKLLTRQIWQRVNDFDSADGRVKVWQADIESKQFPDKEALRIDGMFKASILLRVEVEAVA